MNTKTSINTQPTPSSLPYIEPSIRVIAGFLLTVIGALLFYHPDSLLILLAALFFISLNLFQSGFSGFCLMEKLLKAAGFRSELAEITTLHEEARRSADLQRNYIQTLSLLNEAVIELATDGTVLSVSDGWNDLLGHQEISSQAIGKNLSDFIFEEDCWIFKEMLGKVSTDGEKVHSMRFRFYRDDQAEHWVGGKFMLTRTSGKEAQIRGVLHDITDAYLQEKQVMHMAMHDALTGLPNRAFLEEMMNHAIAHGQRSNSKVGLLFIDLDNFKQVNDIHGHKAGDQLLISVSNLMRQRLRKTDTLARWGGDEFVVLMNDIRLYTDLRDIGESLMRKLADELVLEQFDAIVTLSIGGAIYPDDADTAESLLVQADKALYYAKEQGRNNVQLYTELRNSNLGFYDFDMNNRFSVAIKEKVIRPHYQIIVDANDHKLRGVEALARWHDSKYGDISPSVFIPMAENLGLINELGKQIISQAIHDFSTIASRHPDLTLSVNVSTRQLLLGDFNGWLTSQTNRFQINPAQLTLEITESLSQMGVARARQVVESLRVSGFKISLDDFGTGYSSLSHLHNLPVHEMKIDMSFVKRYSNIDGRIMLEAISAMGRSLGLELVAEGVEDLSCAREMQKLGVDRLQGYFFGKPISWQEFEEHFLAQRS